MTVDVINYMRALQFFICLLLVLFVVKAEDTTALPLVQFQRTIEQLSNNPIEIIYSIKTLQYPNYQEEVFSGNETVLERLRNKTESEEITTEYVKAIIDQERFSYHRIREHGNTGPVGLNLGIISDGLTIRSLLYPLTSMHDLCTSKDSIKAKLDITKPKNTSKISFPILPWNMIRDRVLEVTGWTNSQDWNNQASSNKDPAVMWNQKDFTLKAENGSLVTIVQFSKELGMPIEILGMRADKPFKTIIKIDYKSIPMFDNATVWFPIRIESIQQIEIDGHYKTCISRLTQVYDVKFLTRKEANEVIANGQPVLLTASDLSSISK